MHIARSVILAAYRPHVMRSLLLACLVPAPLGAPRGCFDPTLGPPRAMPGGRAAAAGDASPGRALSFRLLPTPSEATYARGAVHVRRSLTQSDTVRRSSTEFDGKTLGSVGWLPYADVTDLKRAPSGHSQGTGQALLGAEPTNQDHLPVGGGRAVSGRCEDALQNWPTCSCGGGIPRWGTAGRLRPPPVAGVRAEGTADGDADPADRRRSAGPANGPGPRRESRRAGHGSRGYGAGRGGVGAGRGGRR